MLDALLPHLIPIPAVAGSWVGAGATMWHDMFHLDLPYLEKILRPILVYFFLILGLRVAGKRELAQLNPFDLVVLLMLSNTVQNAIIGEDNTIIGGFVGAATLLATNYVALRFVRKSRRLQRFMEGRPDVLVRDGKLLKDHLDHELLTRAELLAAARKQGIASLQNIERCILEPTGNISFIEKQPTIETRKHEELMQMLQLLMGEVTALKAAQATTNIDRPAGVKD